MPPSARRRAFTSSFPPTGLKLLFANDCRQARELSRSHPDITVAITDLTLPDGNWCDVLDHTMHRDAPPSVVVVSPVGGERLWAEVLWRGAYDLLVEPFEGLEVRRTVEGAVRAASAHMAHLADRDRTSVRR
jgi:DNA-binding NtrC family response regulator